MKKLIVVLSFLSLAPSSCYPMAAANPATKRVATELLKKGIEKGTTALHWAIAAAPCWTPIIERLLGNQNDLELMSYSEHDFKKEQHWIREQLKIQGFKNWNNVILKPSDHWSVFSLWNTQSMCYPHNELKDILENDFKKTDVHIASLAHEKTHLEKHHYEKSLGLAITIPFVTHVVWNKIFITSKFSSNFEFRNFFKIITGLCKAQINFAGVWFLKYLHEKEADEGIVNDPIILRAKAQFFEKLELEYKKNGITEVELLLDIHPHPLNRAKRFEKRAVQLCAAQQKV